MGKADVPLPVDDQQGRHPAQLEQPDLLTVLVGYGVVRVRQAYEGVPAAPPMIDEGLPVIRADHDNFGPSIDELLVITAQLRQVPPAVRSGEAAV